jgi:hypothetical protein
MQRLILDAEAGRVSDELAIRGIAANIRVRVVVEVVDEVDLPMSSLAEAGGAFAFLTEEPDLYTDADTTAPAWLAAHRDTFYGVFGFDAPCARCERSHRRDARPPRLG